MPVKDGEMDVPGHALALMSALHELRRQAGNPPTRKIAAEVGTVSHTTVSEALSGRRIPTWPVVARIVEGLGGDPRQFRDMWAAATNNSPGQTERELEEATFAARYRRLTAEYYGTLQLPDFDRRHHARLEELYVPPVIVSCNDEVPTGKAPSLSITEFSRTFNRAVVLGDTGVGKSTLCQALMHQCGSEPGIETSFLIPVRDFAAKVPPAWSVASFIEHRLRTTFQIQPPENSIHRQLATSRTVVIFDGLDEVINTARRIEMARIIELFAAEFPLVRILVTSRIPGYEETRLDPRAFDTYLLSEFDDAQMSQYIRRWFAQYEKNIPADLQVLASDFMERIASPSDAWRNPLALAIACATYGEKNFIPKNVTELYRAYWDLRVNRWDRKRGVAGTRPLEQSELGALRRLAFTMVSRELHGITESQLYRLLFKSLFDDLGDNEAAERATRELLDVMHGRASLVRHVGQNHQGENVVTFFHRTLMEYLAAEHLVQELIEPERLAQKLVGPLARDKWQGVAMQAAQVIDRYHEDGAGRLLELLLDASIQLKPGGRRKVLTFLKQAIQNLSVSPAVAHRIDALWLDVSETDASTRKVDETVIGDRAAIKDYESFEHYINSWQVASAVPEDVAEALCAIRRIMIHAFCRPELRLVAISWSWATLEDVIRGVAQSLLDERQQNPILDAPVGGGADRATLIAPDFIRIAVDRRVITSGRAKDLERVRDLRNRAGHSQCDITIGLAALVKSVEAIHGTISDIYDQRLNAPTLSEPSRRTPFTDRSCRSPQHMVSSRHSRKVPTEG